MGVPVALATMAACGSLVTSFKSGWELRRMVKRKQEQKECDEEAPQVFRRLRRAYYDGLMSTLEYEQWYEKFLVAKVEKDLSGLRRIRAHLRILENGAPVTPSQRTRVHEGSRRRHSVSYAPSPPYADWPQSAGGIEYRPDPGARVGAHPDQFLRLQRPATATYSRSPSSDGSPRSRASRSSSVHREFRGRTERRYDSYDSGGDSSDYYSEKRRYRGRSSQR
ncbi:hypothetical protein VTK56DRAFT_7244 [Thermocarpiscus australiensis]